MEEKIQNTQEEAEKPEEIKEDKTPDELGGILIQAHLKIFDPTTGEVILRTRA